MLKVLETTAQSEKMTTSYNGGQPKDIGQAHLSFVQPIEERSLKQGKFNQEEIEKLRTLLRTLEKPLRTSSPILSGKFPISIGLKALDETFVNSWVIDSDIIDHMTHSTHQFHNYNPCPSIRKITTTNGSLTTIVGVGDIHISSTLTFRKVFHVPKISTNLVSIQKVTKDMGCNVIFYHAHYVF